MLLIDDAIDMLSVAHCLSVVGPVRNDGVALFSGSGGGAALLVDAIDERGLQVASVSAATRTSSPHSCPRRTATCRSTSAR